jgi:LCP family protein required for cell wall assembly
MVHIPDCKDSKGQTIPARSGLSMFNSAFTLGGPGCTVKTVEQTTGVHIDHFVVVDFHGFRDMVNALGGVSVCVPVAVDDNTHNIHLSAGRNKLNGNQALEYVRARYMLGDGSDVQRTERQQLFIGAMIRKALGEGLTRPDRLISFLDAATKSLTTDMSFGQLRTLAQQVEGIGLDKILFATVPTTAYPADPNRLIWTDAAHAIWQGLIDDTGLPGHKRPGAGASSSARPTPVPVVSVAPTAVQVRVIDGTGSLAHARAAANALRARGFVVTSVATGTDASVATTIVRYNPGYDQSARTLHSSLPGSRQQVAPELGRTLEVVVGSDYAQVVKVRVKAAAPTPSASSSPLSVRTALSDGCAPAATASASPSAVAGG